MELPDFVASSLEAQKIERGGEKCFVITIFLVDILSTGCSANNLEG